MIPLFAQETSIWQSIINALSANGLWVLIGICVLLGATKKIVKMILMHRERIAMIESGRIDEEE